jgi:hypothetical protein
MAPYEVAMLFGTLVAETILASVHVRTHRQAGHMDASDLIKTLQNTLRGGGRPHMGLPHLGKQWLNRRPGFVTKPVLVRHVRSVHPANLADLNQKTPAIPTA